MKPVLITGGSGFLGSHVAEQLSRDGQTVRALVRKTSNTKFLETLENVELAEGAVSDAEALERATHGVDTVVHSAGLVKAMTPEDFHTTNAGGTEILLDAAIAAGVRRFVLVSSMAAAGPSPDGTRITVGNESGPVTHYGRSKLAAEKVVLARRDEIEVVILRPPAIYGARDQEILAFFKAVKSRVLPTVMSPEATLSMIYGPDCAAACIAAIAADVPTGSIYFVEDGEVHHFGDLVEAIEASLGTRTLIRFPLPRFVLRTAAFASETYGRVSNQAMMLTRDKLNELFAPHWVIDGTAARAELGWEPKVNIREGIQRTGDWYREAGWL